MFGDADTLLNIRALANNSVPLLSSVCFFLVFASGRWSVPNGVSRLAVGCSPYIMAVYLIHDNVYLRVVVGWGGASVELCQQLLVSALLRCGGRCGVCVVRVCRIRKAESSVVNKEINAFILYCVRFALTLHHYDRSESKRRCSAREAAMQDMDAFLGVFINALREGGYWRRAQC